MSSAIKVSLRSFDDGVRQAYARLFAGDPDKSPEMLRWRFQRNPHGAAKFAVAVADEIVVGMIALVPTKLRSTTGEVLGYQAIDTMVDPACRGQGLFVKLGAIAQDPAQLGGAALWGLPNASAARGWYGHLGWINFGPVPMLIRPLRSGFVLRRLHKALQAMDFPLVGSTHDRFDPLDRDALGGFDDLWNSIKPRLGTSVERSAEWLRWRLYDKPEANYRVVGVLRSAQLDAVVATRISDKHGARLCYFMDALAQPGQSERLASMVRSELANAAGNGAEAAFAWCPPHAPSYAAYRRAGFIPFPARLRPIEINFGARALTGQADAALAAPWTISLLDSDTN